jgi:hypothetical protein
MLTAIFIGFERNAIPFGIERVLEKKADEG